MSYTILYSGEAVVATLGPLTVTATLPNLSIVAGGITVIVGPLLIPTRTDLIAQYKMNDNAASAVVTEHLGLHNATWAHGTTASDSVPGKIKKSLQFLGSDYATIPHHADFNGATFSVSAWVKHDGGLPNFNRIVSKMQNWFDATGYEIALMNWDGGVYINGSSGGGGAAIIATGFNFVGTGWHHLVIVFDGTTSVRLYADGVDRGTGITSLVVNNVQDVTIGTIISEVGVGTSWEGELDNISFHSVALTPAQVAYLYSGGVGTEDIGNSLVLPDLNVLLGAATATLNELGIQVSPQDLTVINSGSVTSVLGEMDVLIILPSPSVVASGLTAIVGQIDVLSTLNDIVIRYVRTSFLDSIIIGITLPSLAVVPLGLTATLGMLNVVSDFSGTIDVGLRAISAARIVAADNFLVWVGIVMTRPNYSGSDDLAEVTAKGFVVLGSDQEAGGNRLYVYGNLQAVMSMQDSYTRMRLPSLFFALRKGEPISLFRIRQWTARKTDLIGGAIIS